MLKRWFIAQALLFIVQSVKDSLGKAIVANYTEIQTHFEGSVKQSIDTLMKFANHKKLT